MNLRAQNFGVADDIRQSQKLNLNAVSGFFLVESPVRSQKFSSSEGTRQTEKLNLNVVSVFFGGL